MSRTDNHATFLTDREESDIKAHRAEFVREALQPVTSIFNRVQQETKGLDAQLKKEIMDGFRLMKEAVEQKFRAALDKLSAAEAELERIEREFETSDLVVELRTEIEQYTSRATVLKRQEHKLKNCMDDFMISHSFLSGELAEKKAELKEICRENLRLHGVIQNIQPLKRPAKIPKLPLMKIFQEVPFDVFTSLSSRDVGHLSISQLKQYITFKRKIQLMHYKLSRLRAKVKLQEFVKFNERKELNVSEVFMLFLKACGGRREGEVTRSLSNTRLQPLDPELYREFQTLTSSRLFTLDTEREKSLRKQRRSVYVSRKELGMLPPREVLGLLKAHPQCVERLRYYMIHAFGLSRHDYESSTLNETKRSG